MMIRIPDDWGALRNYRDLFKQQEKPMPDDNEFKLTQTEWDAMLAALERIEHKLEVIETIVDSIENNMPVQEE